MVYTTEKNRQENISDNIKNKIKELIMLNSDALYFLTITDTQYTTAEQLRFNTQKILKSINKLYKNSGCYIKWLSVVEYNEIISRGNYIIDNVDKIDIHTHIIIKTNIRENKIIKYIYKHFNNSDILLDKANNDIKELGEYMTKQKHLFTDKNFNFFI